MIAVLVNVATVLLGSSIGLVFRNKINEKLTKAVICALALVTVLIGLSSALGTADILCVIICMAFGTVIGELVRIDDGIEGAGDFIKVKLLRGRGNNSRFTEGFVTACMNDLPYTYIYTCGPEPMLKAVSATALTSGQFSFEERMGCGFGACMGCSCKTKYGNKRICKDGPVLQKEEIIWD